MAKSIVVDTKAVTSQSVAERFLAKEVKAVNALGVNGKRAAHLETVRVHVRNKLKGDK